MASGTTSLYKSSNHRLSWLSHFNCMRATERVRDGKSSLTRLWMSSWHMTVLQSMRIRVGQIPEAKMILDDETCPWRELSTPVSPELCHAPLLSRALGFLLGRTAQRRVARDRNGDILQAGGTRLLCGCHWRLKDRRATASSVLRATPALLRPAGIDMATLTSSRKMGIRGTARSCKIDGARWSVMIERTPSHNAVGASAVDPGKPLNQIEHSGFVSEDNVFLLRSRITGRSTDVDKGATTLEVELLELDVECTLCVGQLASW